MHAHARTKRARAHVHIHINHSVINKADGGERATPLPPYSLRFKGGLSIIYNLL